MISSLHIWIGTATAMYMDEFMDACHREASTTVDRQYVRVDYDQKMRSKESIEGYISSVINDEDSIFDPHEVVVVGGPTGESYKDWVGKVIKSLSDLDTECSVLMTVPFMTRDDAPAQIRKMSNVMYHDYSLPAIEDVPSFLAERFSDRGIKVTDRQMSFLSKKADMDPRIIGESFRSLCELARNSGKVTNDMVKSVVGDRVGINSIFDFEEAASAGTKQAIRFCHRVVNQQNSQSLCMQLVASCLSRYRALILLKAGYSIEDVQEGTSFEKADGSQWSMSDKQLYYLKNRVLRSWSKKQLAAALEATTRAYAALKGGKGAGAGREFVMYDFAIGIANAKAL